MFKISISVITVILFINLCFTVNAQDEGEQLFNTICIACHTIGEGKLLGPDLKNMHKRHSEEWMIKFIRSSQNMIKEGDEKAVKLFNEYNMIVMPDNAFTDEQIKSIIAFIKSKSGVEETAKVEETKTTATSEETKTTTTKDMQKQVPSSVTSSKTQTQIPESKSEIISYKETSSVETIETKVKGLGDPLFDEKKQAGSDLRAFLANPVIVIILIISNIILLVIFSRLLYTVILFLKMLKR